MSRVTLRITVAVALALVVAAFLFAYRQAAFWRKVEPFQGRWTRWVAVVWTKDDYCGLRSPRTLEELNEALANGWSKKEYRLTDEPVVIEGDKLTCQSQFHPPEVYLIGALDPTQDPPLIDVYSVETPKRIIGPMKGVYRFDGDWLIITFGQPRPKEVSDTRCEGHSVVFVLKRDK
jgi:uncharacterized protein (TIGR03067 family)